MRFGPFDQTTGNIVEGIVASIEKSGYLPSLAHLQAALEKIRKYDVASIFPMHGPAIHGNTGEVIDGLIAYCTRNSASEVGAA
jgi:hypothetical protein